jgi:sulfite exporter TauE/SafE
MIIGGIYGGIFIVTAAVLPKTSLLLIMIGVTMFFYGLLADQIANIRHEIGNITRSNE